MTDPDKHPEASRKEGSEPFPARLHVLLRPESPQAVVIRRGPADAVCTLAWDLRQDQFMPGQWLRGKIYERRCDISPDGAYLLIFARRAHYGRDNIDAWTALSRVPWLKAVGFWPQHSTWLGGGLFTGPRSFWLNSGADEVPPGFEQSEFPGVERYNSECLGVYFNRLQRDGWQLRERHWNLDEVRFEKPLPRGWTLQKYAYAELHKQPGKSPYYDEHALLHPKYGQLPFPEWEWAERHGDRLVWAEAGCLYAAELGPEGPKHRRLLMDFNDMAFEAIEAPY